ncbi:exodeoxyribonuclease VII large subunit, partial [Methylocystis sp.]|uniref:exodeoxyribonuclease VII large subunit n=1 Tax=Methylocystis sp. TaxID=1911079 RepID=UPI003DA2BB96
AHKLSHLGQLKLRLQAALAKRLQQQQQHLLHLQQNLGHLNPQAVLSRGYALVHDADGQLIRSSRQLAEQQAVHLTLGEGSAEAEVTSVSPAEPDNH